MKESAMLTLSPSQIEEILFEYYFGGYVQTQKDKISETFKVEYKIRKKSYLVAYAKSIDFILEYYTPITSLGVAIRKEIKLSLNDFNNIIDEKISSEGYEIDCLDIESIDYANLYSKGKEALTCVKYFLKKKEKVKTKKKGWR